jgi:hypothetical protein
MLTASAPEPACWIGDPGFGNGIREAQMRRLSLELKMEE